MMEHKSDACHAAAAQAVTTQQAELAIIREDGRLLAKYLRQGDPAPNIITALARLLDPDFINADENRRQLKFARKKGQDALVFGRSKAGNGKVGLRLDVERARMCVEVAARIERAQIEQKKVSMKRIYAEVAEAHGAATRTVRAVWNDHVKGCPTSD